MNHTKKQTDRPQLLIICFTALLLSLPWQRASAFVVLFDQLATSPLGHNVDGLAAYVEHPMRTETLWSMIAFPPVALPYEPFVTSVQPGNWGFRWSEVFGPGSYSIPSAIVTESVHLFTPQNHFPLNSSDDRTSYYSVPSWLYPRDKFNLVSAREGWRHQTFQNGGSWSSSTVGHNIVPLSGPDAMIVHRETLVGMLHGTFGYSVSKSYPYWDVDTTYRTNWFSYDLVGTNSTPQLVMHDYVAYSISKNDATNIHGVVVSTYAFVDPEAVVKRMMRDQNVEDFDLLADYGAAISAGAVLELEMPHVSVIFLCNAEGTGPDFERPIVGSIAAQATGLPVASKFHTANPDPSTNFGRNYRYEFNGSYTNYFEYLFLSFEDGNPDGVGNLGPFSNMATESISSSDSQAITAMRKVVWHGDYAMFGPTGDTHHLRTPLDQAAWVKTFPGGCSLPVPCLVTRGL